MDQPGAGRCRPYDNRDAAGQYSGVGEEKRGDAVRASREGYSSARPTRGLRSPSLDARSAEYPTRLAQRCGNNERKEEENRKEMSREPRRLREVLDEGRFAVTV